MTTYPHFLRDAKSETDWFEALIALARYLRGPEGCPWDREQGSEDFVGFTLNEAHELAEAYVSGDNAHIEEEFGDTFFSLLAAAAAAEEEGRFSLENALRRIHEKMIRRHEHVFGDKKAVSAEDAVRVWNDVKKREKEGKG